MRGVESAAGLARTAGTSDATPSLRRRESLIPYVAMGVFLGVVFTRSEVVSWFRIQEMFRFQSIHMYGIIGSAVAVGALFVWAIKRLEARSFVGRPMELVPDPLAKPGKEHWLGGITFGLGWGLFGACPGPIYVLIGNGVTVMLVGLLAAILGAWTYGSVRHRLPHS